MNKDKASRADPIELARQFLSIPSVSGDEEELSWFLAQQLERLKYKVELQDVSPGRRNVLATTSEEPHLVFSTHLDTVPPVLPTGEDEVYLYGRGACDAKGIMAAEIAAAEELRAEGYLHVGLLFLADEEMGSLGARAANKHRFAASCRYLINGEPTDNRLAVGSKGSLRAVLHTEGRVAHSAYPEMGDSAIEKLLDALARIRNIKWPADDFLGETTCNIGIIAGGTRANVVPSEARADLQIRLVTESESIREALELAVAGLARVEILSVADPIRLLMVEGFEPCVVRFTTDIPHLGNWGTPLLLGPGSILDAHTDHERISKEDLLEAVRLYTKLAHALFVADSAAIPGGRREGARP